MINLQMSRKDREELEALIAKHPNTVIVESADRNHVRCKILVEDGAIYWEFADKDDQFTMIKTRLDDNALTFQGGEIFRLAFLSAKDRISAIRTAHREHNERMAANPSPAMIKKRRKAEIKAAQMRLPGLEKHSHLVAKRWKQD